MVPSASSSALGGMGASTWYFSLLPEEVIRNILRLCSTSPNRSDWPAYLAPQDLCNFVEAMSGIVEVSFHSLYVGKKTDKYMRRQDMARQYLHCDQASIAFVVHHFTRLQVLLEQVEHIEFTPSNGITERDAEAVVSHCGALRSLKSYAYHHSEPLSRIVQARGRQLHTLDACFASKKMTQIVVKSCTCLKELLMFSHNNSLDIILPAVGARLSKLEIRSTIVTEDIQVIKTHCTALEVINLRSTRDHESAHAQLLASYGDQLRYADLNAFQLENVTLVAASCRRVKCVIATDCSEVLVVLGSAADVVKLSFASAKPLDIRKGFEKCTAIQHLLLSGFEEVDDDVLELSLSTPVPSFPALQSLVVGPEAELRRKEVELFSTCTGFLHWLDIAVNCYDTEAILGLNALIGANPRLNVVKVHIVDLTAEPTPEGDKEVPMEVEYFPEFGSDFDEDMDYEEPEVVSQDAQDESLVPDEDGEWAICEILRILTKCANLRELVIGTETRGDKCWDELNAVWDLWANSLRLRRVHLQVLGVSYVPQ